MYWINLIVLFNLLRVVLKSIGKSYYFYAITFLIMLTFITLSVVSASQNETIYKKCIFHEC